MMQNWETGGFALDLDSMDGNHKEFVQMARDLATAPEAEMPALFQKLVDHTREHFAEEGRLMRLYRFPATAEHEGEHHRVFGDLLQMNRQIKRGRVALARAYVKQGLSEWFVLHLSTMDMALATHIKRIGEPPPGVVEAPPVPSKPDVQLVQIQH